MSAKPWMPLYVGDYLADTRRLSTLEHGAYMLLLMDYWQNGSIPTDDESLAQICGLNDKEWMKAKKKIEPMFLPGWKHKRVEEELVKSAEKSKSARISAAASWDSRRNANASANAVHANSDGTCGHDAHARVSLSLSHSQDNNPPSPTISQGEGDFGFEDFWALFPKDEFASRPKAQEAYGELTPAERAQAIAAIPALKSAKPTTHKLSPVRYLRERLFAWSSASRPASRRTVEVERLSPQGEAWERWWRRTKGKGAPWSNGVWHFDSEWPPTEKVA
jgi:uncharacterized protein YdaU (DUF1376 family)